MSNNAEIQVGLTNEVTWEVEEKHLVSTLATGGGPAVFATPWLVSICEDAARLSVDPLLPDGQFTVGTRVDVRHLAATPEGMRVTARSELIEVDGRRLRFHVEVHDDEERVGECDHERFIVDEARFQQNLEEKLQHVRR